MRVLAHLTNTVFYLKVLEIEHLFALCLPFRTQNHSFMYVPVTLKITLKKSKVNKDGLAPILLRYTQNRKIHTISLKKWASPENWMNANGKYIRESGKGAPKNARTLNSFLRSILLSAEDIVTAAQRENRAISFSELKAQMVNSNSQDFIQFCKDEIARREKSSFAESSIKTYRSDLNKLEAYKDRIAFSDITLTFLEELESYLIHDLQNKENTIFRMMKFIKTMLNVARKKKISDVYPFNHYKITYKKDTRDRLDIEELERLQNLHDKKTLPAHLQNVLHYFLFACYTGLSFSDLERLDYTSIAQKGEEYFIRSKRKKTDNPFIVPLLKNALNLIDVNRKRGVVFPDMLTNQKSNKSLKEIISLCNINKIVSFHVARHTFGTVALNQGIPQEVVQKMMGHSSSEMTSGYAKVLDDYVLKEMKKWKQEKAISSDNYLDRLSASTTDVYKKLRIRIIATRIANGISEVDMAEKLQVSEERYKDLEQGKVEIGVGELLVIGEVFGVDFLLRN